MRGLLSLVGAAVFAGGGLWLALLGAANLPITTRLTVVMTLLVVAALAGFAAGSVVGRRAAYDSGRLVVFSGLAGGIAGAIVGAAFAMVLTAAYLLTFATLPPPGILDDILTVLAFPAFGAVGLILGGLLGLLFGLLLGEALQISRRR